MLEVEGGTRGVVHADPAPRERATRSSTRTRCTAGARWRELFGRSVEALSRRTTARTPPAAASCCTSTAVVRAEPSRRGLRRDVRGVARAARGWRRRYAGWPALQKLEYVDELMARDRAASGRASATRAQPIRSPTLAQDAARALRREARAATRSSYPDDLRPRPAAALLRRSAAPRPAPSARRRSCAATAREIRRARRALDRRVPVHDRPGAEGHDRPRARAASCASVGPTSAADDWSSRRC